MCSLLGVVLSLFFTTVSIKDALVSSIWDNLHAWRRCSKKLPSTARPHATAIQVVVDLHTNKKSGSTLTKMCNLL